MRQTIFICAMIGLLWPAAVQAEQPLEILQKAIQEGITLLKPPDDETPSASVGQVQVQRLWGLADRLFDFNEFARRVLAAHWRRFTPVQRRDFTQVFAQFLRNKYLPQLQAKYRGESIIEMRQELISPVEAVIHAKVLHRKLEIPIDIRMRKGPGTWKVYDLNILGVSAVGNYRVQLDAVLRKHTPARTIELLRSKL